MNRCESTVRSMLQAIEAPLYDLGVLSDRGMLPGVECITAEAVLSRFPLLRYRNARGSHIYIHPEGEHRFTVLDDLSEAALARLGPDGCSLRDGRDQPRQLPGMAEALRGSSEAARHPRRPDPRCPLRCRPRRR